MKPVKENRHNGIKDKRANLFQRFGRRISKYFNKSKTPLALRSCTNDIPITSVSHENLNGKNISTSKRKLFGDGLNCSITPWQLFKRMKRSKKGIPEINSRCMSEGDLTREKAQFYSQDTSPNDTVLRAYESNRDYSKRDECERESSSFRCSFKAELSLKLRSKSQRKGEESDVSKTPDSTIVNGIGASPSRPYFGDVRTPWSTSSLSHSSNSLLSSTVANNYGTSDGESMSRSMIDPTDEIGIVADLTTPISKTTHAALLDSTAARQKISASKARRTKPKVPANLVSEKVSSDDSAKFSPIRDKRDPLEEISEEEYLTPFSVAAYRCGIRESDTSYSTPLEGRSELKKHLEETTRLYNLQKSDKTEKNSVKLRNTTAKETPKPGIAPTGDSYLSLKVKTIHKTKEAPFGDSYVAFKANETNKVTEPGDISRASKANVINPGRSPNAGEVPSQSGPKIIRHNRLSPSKLTKCDSTLASSSSAADEKTAVIPTVATAYGEKRSSKVLTMLKNFESVPCAECP